MFFVLWMRKWRFREIINEMMGHFSNPELFGNKPCAYSLIILDKWGTAVYILMIWPWILLQHHLSSVFLFWYSHTVLVAETSQAVLVWLGSFCLPEMPFLQGCNPLPFTWPVLTHLLTMHLLVKSKGPKVSCDSTICYVLEQVSLHCLFPHL